MILNKYKASDTRKAITLMTQPHYLHIRVRLLDLDHKYLNDLTGRFAGGTVAFDASADITRGLDLTLFDPQQKVQLDPFSPSRTGVFITQMVQIIYVIRAPLSGQQFEWPVFTGPIDKVEHDGIYLNLKCLGKERLSLDNLWRGKTYKKGRKKTDVIKDILRDLAGETKLNIPDKNDRLPEDLKLNRKDSPWKAAKRLADGMGYQLYYDGRGYAVMRKWPNKSVMTFREHQLVERPHVSNDLSKTVNAVRVIGKKPKRRKRSPKATVKAPPGHELSPKSLGRGNPKVPRYLWVEIQDDQARTKIECKRRARKVLDRGLRAGKEVKFDGAPMPMLEEEDVCKLDTNWTGAEFPMIKWDLPLVAGDDASYGYLKRRVPKHKRAGKNKGKDKGKGRDRG
jgi:hypothetical protein